MQAKPTTDPNPTRQRLMPDMHEAQDVYDVLWRELKHNLLHYNQTTSMAQDQVYLALQYRLRQLNDLLEDSADYLYQLHLAQHAATQVSPWLWRILADDGEMQLGLLTIDSNHPTPLHNHPGKCGAGLVLSGDVQIDQFNQQQLEISADYPIIKLKPHSCGYYQAGQMPSYTCGWGNVQRLQAVGGRAVLLIVQLQCTEENEACWYFAISPEDGKHSFFAQRLKRYA